MTIPLNRIDVWLVLFKNLCLVLNQDLPPLVKSPLEPQGTDSYTSSHLVEAWNIDSEGLSSLGIVLGASVVVRKVLFIYSSYSSHVFYIDWYITGNLLHSLMHKMFFYSFSIYNYRNWHLHKTFWENLVIAVDFYHWFTETSALTSWPEKFLVPLPPSLILCKWHNITTYLSLLVTCNVV